MKYLILTIFLFSGKLLFAQSFPIGGLEDQSLRLMQLEGKLSSAFSFSARPYTSGDSITYASIQDWLEGIHQPWEKPDRETRNQPSFSWLPVNLKTQFNSHHPFGWNDGAMIPAKGLQTLLSAGVFAKAGPLSIQLQPELVYAANPNFVTSSLYGAPTNGAYKKIFPGQSAIRLNVGKVSLGLSSENLWWGPGTNGSLLMSNNAPGFVHLTFNSTRPIKTPIGSFEWQIVGGRLEHDSSLLSQVYSMKPAIAVVYPRTQDWRYLNGISLSWQPKWIKGLSFGINRVFQIYSEDLKLPPINVLDDYLPVFGSLFKKTISGTEDKKKRDQQIALSGRWVFQPYQSEIYVQYGWNDHSYDIRDFVMAPSHSAAYLFGFKKLIDLNNQKKLLVEAELTQMQPSSNNLTRPSGNWYEHGIVLTGSTHHGQIMGSGSGFGNNVQMLSLKQIDGFQQFGIEVLKIQNNPLISPIKWTDYVLGVNGQMKKEQWLLQANAKFVYSDNYAWLAQQKTFNFFINISLQYRL